MSEPEGESDQLGDFLMHFLGHATFTEMLRITHEVYAMNAAAPPEEIIKLLNERMKIPDKVNAALNQGDPKSSNETS